MLWNPGQQLFGDRYIIERKLGEDGIGITYLARNQQGKLRVIKTLREEILNDPAWIPHQDRLKQDFKIIPGIEKKVLSPTGDILASWAGSVVHLFSSTTGQLIRSLISPHSDAVASIAISSDGQILASVGWNTIKEWLMPTNWLQKIKATAKMMLSTT